MAEGFFIQQMNQTAEPVQIMSAGLSALVDHSADQDASSVMKKHGIDISAHRARQLTSELVKQANLILVMTESHLRKITQNFMMARGKTFLLGHWSGFEIEDPYQQSQQLFEKTYEKIELAWQDWKTRISS